MNNKLLKIALFLTLTLPVACAFPDPEPRPQPGRDSVPDQLQDQLTAFVNAVVDRDPAALEATVSEEVLAHARHQGLSPAAFLERQRAALVARRRTADRPVLAIGEIDRHGRALRASVYLDEQQLPRRLYFVQERGAFRLNLGPPDAPPSGRCEHPDDVLIDLTATAFAQMTESLRKVR